MKFLFFFFKKPYLSYHTSVSAPSIRVLFSAAPSHGQMISPKGDAKGREMGAVFDPPLFYSVPEYCVLMHSSHTIYRLCP